MGTYCTVCRPGGVGAADLDKREWLAEVVRPEWRTLDRYADEPRPVDWDAFERALTAYVQRLETRLLRAISRRDWGAFHPQIDLPTRWREAAQDLDVVREFRHRAAAGESLYLWWSP